MNDLAALLSIIYRKSPLQKKMIEAHLRSQGADYFERAERFTGQLALLLAPKGLTLEYAADAYLRLCSTMLAEQIRFRKTGTYSCRSGAEAHQQVYSSEGEMAPYMYGLALSIFLWPNHYKMFTFFGSQISPLTDVRAYLEVGPGHGLFLAEALARFPDADCLAVDVSRTSLQISRAIVDHLVPENRCAFAEADIAGFDTRAKYDLIVMCEVLEHLDRPADIMRQLHRLLRDDGHLFITTCANCPAVDHVYLYESVAHIRREIRETGFTIASDLPLPVGPCEGDDWTERPIEVNYAAMLCKTPA